MIKFFRAMRDEIEVIRKENDALKTLAYRFLSNFVVRKLGLKDEKNL